jgi:pyruvate, orthophosphate dikinase
MMDTVLNLGLNDETVEGLAGRPATERFAYDAYRRFIQLFGKVVLGVDGGALRRGAGEALRRPRGPRRQPGSTPTTWPGLSEQFAKIIAEDAGRPFPQDPREQLQVRVEAVFRSWNGRRARDYRRMEGIPTTLGTAVNVQAMVFGNLGDDSGTGVAFTRNPATGEATPYGDWLPRCPGRGRRRRDPQHPAAGRAARRLPRCRRSCTRSSRTLEGHYRDMCDIEFTIERSRLYILQTRVGKRTAAAALQMAVDMVDEGLIDTREAVSRVTPQQLEQLLHPQFAPTRSTRSSRPA